MPIVPLVLSALIAGPRVPPPPADAGTTTEASRAPAEAAPERTRAVEPESLGRADDDLDYGRTRTSGGTSDP